MAPRQSKCERPVDCDAFLDLMSSRKANEAGRKLRWLGTKADGWQRKAPFYKVIQGMPIAIGAICYGAIPGVTPYFLTSLYESFVDSASRVLSNSFAEGKANLIIHMLSD
ncbi:hypothetical protein EDB89DRAFT_826419 [Lactarius sanguifluus]|nr:hypothetical protein EDB89DRAFT_826419 [Lactarius sanguifluus]